MRRVIVLSSEVTLDTEETNLDKATLVRVLNDSNSSIVLTVDDAAVVIERGGPNTYKELGTRTITIAGNSSIFLEKYPLETISGEDLKCTKITRQ